MNCHMPLASAFQETVVVVLTHKITTGALDTRITLNAQHKVSGLLFSPSSAGSEYHPPAYADPAKFEEQDITVSSGNFELTGTLTVPKGSGPFPAVVLVHGSGPHDRDENVFGNRPFKDLAWGLAGHGVATLRYDKRTQQYGAALDPKTLTVDQEVVDDAIAAVRLLTKRQDLDRKRIFVVGHSLGAVAAPYTATRESQIAGIVMLAASARPVYELVPEQQEYIFRLDGRLGPAESAQLERVRGKVEKIRQGTYGQADKMLGAPSSYWHDLDRLDPIAHAEKLNIPILIVHGSRDYQVTSKEHRLFKDALAEKNNVTFKMVDGMDHLLRIGQGPSAPAQYRQVGHVDAQVITLIAEWIRSACPANR